MSITEQDELPLTVDETDSTLGEDIYSEDDTITSSVYKYPEENGRQYHAYKDGVYPFPNDEQEQNRLDFQHRLSLCLEKGQLYLSPVRNPCEVLDIGTGTGIWAIEMADQHPHARVLGIDLSPIQPDWVAPNCHFQIWDFEDPWDFKRQFDLIHGRLLIGSISNPRYLLRQAYQSLAPGGWLEFQDVCPPTSDDNTIPPGSSYCQWVNTWCQALETGGRDPFLAAQYENLLQEAGFVNVNVRKYKVPQNHWPKNRHYKKLGTLNALNISEGIEGLSMRPLTKFLGWSAEEVQVLLAKTRSDVNNTKLHAYWPV